LHFAAPPFRESGAGDRTVGLAQAVIGDVDHIEQGG